MVDNTLVARAGTARGRSQRTQEERRAETRAKLLDATIESILEVGYAQTTTRHVAERAGVSAGAQAHHFPRRVDLEPFSNTQSGAITMLRFRVRK